MIKELQLLKTDLINLFHPEIIQHLLRDGYRKTENKFSLTFNGSKGYLDNIEISCEGYQTANNRISCVDIFNKNGGVKKKVINVFFSEANGVRLSLGADKARVVECTKCNGKRMLFFMDDAPRKCECSK